MKIWNEWPRARSVREAGDDSKLDTFVQRIAEEDGFAERWDDIGPLYGKLCVDRPTCRYRRDGLYEEGGGVDQVAQVVESLRTNPGSRRHTIER